MQIFELHIFGLTIAPTYYGLAYALGILGAYYWVLKRGRFSSIDLDHLLWTVVGGIIIGGRLGYILFYNLPYYLHDPFKILALHEGGMSFHGGIIGVVIGISVFSYIKRIPLLMIGDEIGITIPIGIFLGRIANYLNNELVGYAGYTGPFAMLQNGIYHFPSPLLEAFLEGIVLVCVLIIARYFTNRTGVISGLFLSLYALARLFVEGFFRLPDVQIGYIMGLTMGQILSLPLLIAGLGILVYSFSTRRYA